VTRTILITGGAGFIGAHLARAHIEEGDEVHILIRPTASPAPGRVHRSAIVHRVDMTDYPALLSCVAATRAQVIYHLAADAGRNQKLPEPSDIGSLTTDLDNVLRLAAAAAEAPVKPAMLITAQSLAVYANGPWPSREDQREAPLAPYAASMVAAAHYLSVMQPRLPFAVLHARLALTFGPGQPESFFIPWLIDRCRKGIASEVLAPEDRRDLVHVEDIVAGFMAMSRTPLPAGTIINLSSGKAPTMREVASLIVELTAADRHLVRFSEQNPADIRSRAICSRNDRARDLLGWRPHISLREGIAHLVSSSMSERAA
jgi:UDP-glucose 4-epimerase